MISGKTVALIKEVLHWCDRSEANQSTIAELEKVGEKIGLAFQMQDDYLEFGVIQTIWENRFRPILPVRRSLCRFNTQ